MILFRNINVTLSLQTLAEQCEGIKRRLSDMRLDVDDVKNEIPAETREVLDAEHAGILAKLETVADKLKSRGDALDGVLPFITSLQVVISVCYFCSSYAMSALYFR